MGFLIRPLHHLGLVGLHTSNLLLELDLPHLQVNREFFGFLRVTCPTAPITDPRCNLVVKISPPFSLARLRHPLPRAPVKLPTLDLQVAHKLVVALLLPSFFTDLFSRSSTSLCSFSAKVSLRGTFDSPLKRPTRPPDRPRPGAP